MTTKELLHILFANHSASAEEVEKRYPYFKMVHLYNYLNNPQDQLTRQKAGMHFTQHYWLGSLINDQTVSNGFQWKKNDEVISGKNSRPAIVGGVMGLLSAEEEIDRDDINEQVIIDQHPVEQIHETENPLPTVEPVTANIPKETVEEKSYTAGFATEDILTREAINAQVALEMEPAEQIHETENPLPTEEPVSENDPKQWEGGVSMAALPVDKFPVQIHESENPLPAEEPVSVNYPKDGNFKNASPKLEIKLQDEKGMQDSPPLFEPLHTTDYFASQGIKITDEVQGTGNVDRKLRSFTQWLKTMKRLPGTVEQNLGAVRYDKQVETLAEISNKEEEILTEAMANAYVQQGKPQKAREIYTKLSLINPEKSSYFAALIEKL